MEDLPQNPHGIQPPPARNERGHTLPRRAPPEQSVTLLHHQLARDSPPRADRAAVEGGIARSTRRSSVGESNATCSEPKHWFDKSNRNPTATFDHNQMDVDPPFFQQETDSSNELELPPRIHTPYGQALPGTSHQRPAATRQSSSADDFRSVIDDLTIENKRLKEELKRYKQSGSGMMKKEKLFEIKVHGLPNRKKRELEATLRDFAASLEGSSETASQERLTKPGKHMKNFHASRNSLSKHASSSSTNSRPVDSAYASMSTGPSVAAPQSSTGPSLHGPPSFSASRTMSNDRKVEGYLLDTPEGLLPRHTVMTDREKKKMVVRRLEQLFTGKISAFLQPLNPEAVRESRIQTSGKSGKKAGSGDNMSVNSGDRTEPHGAGDASGNQSVHNELQPPEQRPTRPRDLDPHRVQVPGENMDYIRHLGIVRPDFLVDKKALRHDVAADADGWVYLNLLSNLAQLHMVNVTPAFIRSAVSEKSTKFQLSADGRKIRWRGGTDGTKFSSDSSTDNSSQKSPLTDEDDPIDGVGRKKRKTSAAATDAQPSIESIKGSGSKSLLGQVSTSSSFHYKPLFVRQSSSVQTSSSDGKASQASLSVRDGDSPNKKSPWNISGSGSAQRMKRRRDGAIIYYSGAPFCTDLSGDRGDISPTTYMTSNGQERDLDLRAFRPIPHRSWSGSSLLVRPLSDDRAVVEEALDIDLDDPQLELVTDDGDSGIDLDFDFPWCDKPTSIPPISFPLEPCLEPCGLGGVMPEDHFAVICYTRHPVIKAEDGKLPRAARGGSEEILEAIAGRLATMSTSSPAPPSQRSRESSVDMTYLSGRMRRLDPVPLPPPARFIPPFSSDSSSGDTYDESFSDDDEVSELQESSESLISKLGNPRLSDNAYIDSGNTSSNDDSNAHEHMVIADLGSSSDRLPGSPTVAEKVSGLSRTDSAAANVGEEHESGYSSSVEDDESPLE